MRILVTFALENEFALWRTVRTFHRGKWGRAEAFFADIEGATVGVVLTGAGLRQAARMALEIGRGDDEPASFCISSGFAGALRAESAIGEILVARSVYAEYAQPDSCTHVPCSGALLSFASECGATVVDRIYSVDRAIVTAEEKRALAGVADAVDMESFEILLQAGGWGSPAVAIRAVSDVAGEDLPLDMNRVFTEDGKVSIPRVLGQVALHPQSVPGLVRLGKNSKRAAESLARFLDAYVVSVSRQMNRLERGDAGLSVRAS